MTTPQVRVRQVPVTSADREAMLHKHPLENLSHEIGRKRVSPTLSLVATHQISEVYRYEFEGIVKVYDIRLIKEAIYKKEIPVQAIVMDLTDAYVDHVFNMGGCEQDHLNSITLKDIKRPAIGILYDDGLQVVDGSHRIVARWRRFNKQSARLLIIPGVVDFRFLINEKDLSNATWLKR